MKSTQWWFLFEKYVYGLMPSKKLSFTASILIDNLDAIDG